MNLTEINIYPIKSLHGIAMGSGVIEARGMQNDRRWMLVDDKRNFISQRECPPMARIRVAILDDALSVRFDGDELLIPFDSHSDALERVTVWQSSVKAAGFSPDVDRWFADRLEIPCRLFAMTAESVRPVSPNYAVRKFEDVVSFADGYPYMLIGEGSLADLNSRLEVPVPMTRFRPIFVVGGAEPFVEDTWRRVRIGSTVFYVVKPCERCVMTTIDQNEGFVTGPEPLRTLADYRRSNGKVLFGQNMIADVPGGILSLGDEVEVLEER